MNDAIAAFGQSLRGQLIGRDHAEYESARKLYNAMIDKRPLLIARCADVADVIASVNFGRDNGLLTAIRGGGHNGPGLGSCDDGLVIDLSLMKGVRTDVKTRTVRVGPGCTTGDVDHATYPFGLAVPTGTVSSTGIAGLTLGGGIGYLSRQFGLTIDNLLEADVVLADGSFVTASETENADLLWGLRGAAGISASSRAFCSGRTRCRWSMAAPCSGRSSTPAPSCSVIGNFSPTRPRSSACSSACKPFPRRTRSRASIGASASA